MGQLLLPENLPSLLKASGTSCTLAASYLGMATRFNIGGQQYALSSTLTLNTGTVGAGGLDAGALSNTHSLYYVYAIVHQTTFVPALIASLGTSGPTVMPSGYGTAYKLVGAFYSMDSASQIGATVSIVGPAMSDWQNVTATNPDFFGTFTVHYHEWRRIGSVMEMRLRLVTGTVVSGTAAIALPTSFNIPGTPTQSRLVGECITNNTQNLNVLVQPSVNTNQIFFGQNTAANAFTAINATVIGTGITIGMFASMTIAGWPTSLT